MFFKNILDSHTIPHIQEPLLMGQSFEINTYDFGRAGWHLMHLVFQGHFDLSFPTLLDSLGEGVEDIKIVNLNEMSLGIFEDQTFFIFCDNRIVPFSFRKKDKKGVWDFKEGLEKLLPIWQDINAGKWKIAQSKNRFISWPQDYILPRWMTYVPHYSIKPLIPKDAKAISYAVHTLLCANDKHRAANDFSLLCEYDNGHVGDFSLVVNGKINPKDAFCKNLIDLANQKIAQFNNFGICTAFRTKNYVEALPQEKSLMLEGFSPFYYHSYPEAMPSSHEIMSAKAFLLKETTHDTIQALDAGQ